MLIFLILFFIALVTAAIVYLFGRETVLASIFGPADQDRIVFKELIRSSRPNNALICPDNYCEHASPEIIAPVFSVSAVDLRDRLRGSLKSEWLLERVHTNDPALRERYIQRSKIFRFPDTNQIEYIPISPRRSTIALYSRAQIGYGDGKVNLKRLKRWNKTVGANYR